MGGWGSGQRGWRCKGGSPRPILEWLPAIDPTYLDRVLKVMDEEEEERWVPLSWCEEDEVFEETVLIRRHSRDIALFRVAGDTFYALKKRIRQNGYRWWMECPGCLHLRNRALLGLPPTEIPMPSLSRSPL